MVTNRQWLMEQMQNMSDEEFNQMEFQKMKNEEMGCGRKNCVYRDCDKCELNWLKAEHKEKPKLKEAERVILENIDKEYKWIVRNEGGHLMVFECKPKKGTDFWHTDDDGYYTNIRPFNHLFQFIKWEDDQPYNIEELLRGE